MASPRFPLPNLPLLLVARLGATLFGVGVDPAHAPSFADHSIARRRVSHGPGSIRRDLIGKLRHAVFAAFVQRARDGDKFVGPGVVRHRAPTSLPMPCGAGVCRSIGLQLDGLRPSNGLGPHRCQPF